MQQLLRDWEANCLAMRGSIAALKPARARTRPDDCNVENEPRVEAPLVACPCDACSFRRDCAAGLACERYTMFLHGSSQKHWEAAPCEPTRAKFEAVSS